VDSYKWGTHRCQSNCAKQIEGRGAAVVPGDEKKPAPAMKASRQQTGAAVQDLNPLCTKNKARA